MPLKIRDCMNNEHALTRGDLPIHEMKGEKSEQAIVVSGNEL